MTQLRSAIILSRRLARIFSAVIARVAMTAALIVTTAVSPIAFALEIKLGTGMHIRSVDDNMLVSDGVLAAGSIVEIPDKYAVKSHGKIDADASFNNWLAKVNYDQSAIDRKIKNPRKDFYYPVRIVKIAKGSTASKNLKNQVRFMALRVLARSHGGMVVKETSPFYVGRVKDVPLDASGDLGGASRSAETSAPARETQARKPKAQAAAADDSSSDQRAASTAPEDKSNSEPRAQDQSRTEAADPSDCADCNKTDMDRSAANRLGQIVTSKVAPNAYNDEARGMQGLSSAFGGHREACSAFIKSDGTYGLYGQLALREIAKYPAFLDDWKGGLSACPNFNSFNDAEKRHYWVYLFAALSAREAGCSNDPETSRAPKSINPNGHADGLYQMEESEQARDNAGRGPSCDGDPWDARVNTRCGVSMIEKAVRLGEGPYTRKNQYYSSFRDSGTLTKRLASTYEACGANAVSASHHRSHSSRRHHSKKRSVQ